MRCIRFAEKNNPSNYFEVRISDNGTTETSYIAAFATGQTQLSYLSTKSGNKKAWALPDFWYLSNPTGYTSYTNGWGFCSETQINGTVPWEIKLFYDKEVNAIYYLCRWYGNNYETLLFKRT